MTPAPHVLVGATSIEPEDRRRLAAAFPAIDFTFAVDPNQALAAAPDAEIIFTKGVEAKVIGAEGVTAEALAAARRLRWYQAGTAGVEGAIALLREHHAGRDVVLTNARGAHGIPLAENVLAMALCFATRMHRLIRTQPARARIGREVILEKWELHGQTMLVLGLGDVGGTLAHKARALGMRVIGVRRSGEAHPDCERVVTPDRLHEALPEADHVAVCLPLTGETRTVLGEAELRLMKRTAHVYNVGRGPSIEGRALRRALVEGRIAGAGLDCVDPSDVPDEDDVLWGMENAILSHHTGGSSPYNSARITGIFADNLRRYVAGEPLRNVVDWERGY